MPVREGLLRPEKTRTRLSTFQFQLKYEGVNMTLAEAVQCGSMSTVERLLQEGADINEMDAAGWTPLNWAAAAGDISMAKLLLKFGRHGPVSR